MLNRRNFMQFSALTAAGMILPGLKALAGEGQKVGPIGLQLYTARQMMQKNVAQTLNKIAAIGYSEVEFAGYFGHSAQEIAVMLADNGLTAPSAHIGIDDFEHNFEQILDSVDVVGHKYLILAWLPPKDRTLDRYKEIIDTLNKNGEKAKAAGVQLAYHNHNFEFENIDGEIPYEMILTQTDEKLVQLELDLFWFAFAKQDPLKVINRYPGRVPAVHIKDMGKNRKMVNAGTGTIDFMRVFQASKKAGIKHYFVEDDETKDITGTIEAGYDYLSKVRY
jgi:sugar phosphate isomerase/epimerase